MAIADTNAVLISYLTTASTKVSPLIALVASRVYCPRLPENASLPAVSLFTRGGPDTNPHIPGIVIPSVQIDCWADDPLEARNIYRKVYDALQGIQNVTVGSSQIMSAIEEVQGQDLVDVEIENYFRVLTFFSVMVRAE